MNWPTLRKKIIPSAQRWTVVAYRLDDGQDVVPSGRFFTSKRAAQYWADSHSHFVAEVYLHDGVSPWFAIPASEAHLSRGERGRIFRKLFDDARQDYPAYYRLVRQQECEAAAR